MNDWLDNYKKKIKRKEKALAERAKRFKKPVYIITPVEHGNGGWCGSTTHTVTSIQKALKMNPVTRFHRGHYDPTFGSRIRICKKNDVNKPLYTWDNEENKWKKW